MNGEPVSPEKKAHQQSTSKQRSSIDRRGARRSEGGPSRVPKLQESYEWDERATNSTTYHEPLNHQSPEPRLLSVQEAARFLAVSPWMIRSMIWRGTLPSVKIGNGKRKRVLVDRLDLSELIARLKHREEAS